MQNNYYNLKLIVLIQIKWHTWVGVLGNNDFPLVKIESEGSGSISLLSTISESSEEEKSPFLSSDEEMFASLNPEIKYKNKAWSGIIILK